MSKWLEFMKGETKRRGVGRREIGRGNKGDKERE